MCVVLRRSLKTGTLTSPRATELSVKLTSCTMIIYLQRIVHCDERVCFISRFSGISLYIHKLISDITAYNAIHVKIKRSNYNECIPSIAIPLLLYCLIEFSFWHVRTRSIGENLGHQKNTTAALNAGIPHTKLYTRCT